MIVLALGDWYVKELFLPCLEPMFLIGVPKDNFTVEVPEASIIKYSTTAGWKDFKRIAAYRNFVCRPNSATALNASTTRDLILNANGAWEVESKPDWVTLSQTSGNLKTALKLTFSEMPKGSASEGFSGVQVER
jgi:hypothetical protein